MIWFSNRLPYLYNGMEINRLESKRYIYC